MSASSQHAAPLARLALLVAVGDYLTKSVAAWLLAGHETIFSSWLRFAVVHNDQGAFGLSMGTYTWQLNLAVTLAAIAFMIPVSRDLARIDSAAPRALGLIMGGALGNLASLVLSPKGVVDFIGVTLPSGSGLVLNVADIAAYVGLAMIVRTGALIVLQMRLDRRVRARTSHRRRREEPLPIFSTQMVRDREVPRLAVLDGASESESGCDVVRPLFPVRRPRDRASSHERAVEVAPGIFALRPSSRSANVRIIAPPPAPRPLGVDHSHGSALSAEEHS